MSSPNSRLRLTHALALGLLHGPAELLPVSSSGHVTVVPWLLGWDYPELDPDLRKAFEVALHAGTAAALMVALRDQLPGDRRGLTLAAFSAAPPALAGYLLERPIKRHLGTPGAVAAGLLAGAVAIALADRAPQRRDVADAGAADALWLGVAQACALIPGISRNGATLATARLRHFTRRDAARLSWRVAPPPIAGATVLEAVRARRRLGVPGAAGAGAAFLSTFASRRLLLWERSLLPFAVYRIALAGVVLWRLRG